MPQRGGRRPHDVGAHAAVGDPGRRSRAWGILAVSLALMALVTALSSTTSRRTLLPTSSRAAQTRDPTVARPHASGARSAPHSFRPHAFVFVTGALGDATASTHAAGATVAAGGTAATAAGATAAVAAAVGGVEGTSSSSTRQVAAEAPGGGTATPSPSSPVATSPNRVLDAAAPTATFSVPGGGVVSADAEWSGTPSLELSITCPGGISLSRTGGPGLSVEADDSRGGSAPCAVSLSLPPGVRADVSFTLTIEPAS